MILTNRNFSLAFSPAQIEPKRTRKQQNSTLYSRTTLIIFDHRTRTFPLAIAHFFYNLHCALPNLCQASQRLSSESWLCIRYGLHTLLNHHPHMLSLWHKHTQAHAGGVAFAQADHWPCARLDRRRPPPPPVAYWSAYSAVKFEANINTGERERERERCIIATCFYPHSHTKKHSQPNLGPKIESLRREPFWPLAAPGLFYFIIFTRTVIKN